MSFVKILFPQFGFNAHYFNELVSLDGNTIAMIRYTFCVHLQEFKINETLPSCEILEQNAGRNSSNFTKDMNQAYLVRTSWHQEDIFVLTDIDG